MKTQDYIINAIEKLFSMFSYMSFTYGYESITKQHIIEVQPTEDFTLDRYMEAESDVVSQFIKIFPDEDLLFISNDPFIKVESPIYIKKPIINAQVRETASSQWPNQILVQVDAWELLKNIQYTNQNIKQAVMGSQVATNTNFIIGGEYSYAMAA